MCNSTEGTDAAGRTEHPSKSECHWLFSEPRCRTTLQTLDELTLPVDLLSLAMVVSRKESDGEVEEEQVNEVAAHLHHRHLPKMDRLGVIRYDSKNVRVSDREVSSPTIQ